MEVRLTYIFRLAKRGDLAAVPPAALVTSMWRVPRSRLHIASWMGHDGGPDSVRWNMDSTVANAGHGAHPVIALHGWFGHGAAWAPILPHLDTSKFQYVFPDYRGYGARQAESGEYTLDEICGDVLNLADEHGFETFSLLGHSMGGIAMQRVLAEAPERVRALVGISPVPASGMPFDEAGRQLFGGAADNPANRRAIIDFTTGNRLTDVWLDAMVRDSLANSRPEAVSAYLTAWSDNDIHAQISGSQLPVQVLVGEHDPALNAEVMRETYLRWYPNCTLEVMAGAGHYAIDETPVALATAIENFLAEV